MLESTLSELLQFQTLQLNDLTNIRNTFHIKKFICYCFLIIFFLPLFQVKQI